MSILNKYKKFKHLLITIRDRYYDFVLTQSNPDDIAVTDKFTENGLSGYINFTLDECVSGDTFVSLDNYKWDGAYNDGVELKDIGLTGIDNGLLKFNKDTITDDELYNILTKSSLTFTSGDTKMHVFPVDGNTKQYSYDYEYFRHKYISLKGGFLQGVFMVDGFDYQILPQYIDNSMHVEFTMRPNKYIVSGNTLNSVHPNNSGIFFYMGARAENKFAILNGADISNYPNRTLSGYTEDIMYSGVTITDSEGNDISKIPLKEIETDNKYLLFNHTKNGFTVDTWDENTDVVLQMERNDIDENMFLLMNHTKSGYTVDTIDSYISALSGQTGYAKYDIMKDTMNNAFALKLNDDYSIGYRYLVKDCDSENGWSIKEEKTFPNIISESEWSTIHVRFQILNGNLDDCGLPKSTRKMKIYIYVNGYLKLVSQEMEEFSFTRLDEYYTKQEMVPFSISIGGGTQGLCDMVWFNNEARFNKVLPLEENFAGSFVGDISSFKIYSEPLTYNEIKSNYLYEKKTVTKYSI